MDNYSNLSITVSISRFTTRTHTHTPLKRLSRGMALPLAGSFMRHKGAAVLLQALRRYGSREHTDASVTREACGALRSVTLGDDRRKDFSGVRWIL